MNAREERIRRRAVKAGIRAAKRQHHALSAEEVRSLKVQVLGPLPRVAMVTSGVAMIAASWTGWPVASNVGQGLLAIGGIVLVLFGLCGVRRTVSGILDQLSSEAAGDFLGSVLGSIADAVDF